MEGKRLDAIISDTNRQDDNLALVQSAISFDWNALSGTYKNTVSSPQAKMELARFDPSKGIDWAPAARLGDKASTYTFTGNLEYDQDRFSKINGIHAGQSLKNEAEDGFVVKTVDGPIDLSNKLIVLSESATSFGAKFDPNTVQKSTKVTLSDQNGLNRQSFLYVEQLEGKKIIDSQLYECTAGALLPLNKPSNEPLLKLMRTVDFYHAHMLKPVDKPTSSDFTNNEGIIWGNRL